MNQSKADKMADRLGGGQLGVKTLHVDACRYNVILQPDSQDRASACYGIPFEPLPLNVLI